MATPAILRKDHSLEGRNVVPVIKALRAFKGTLPTPLARLRKDHPLEKYSKGELVGHLEGLLGTEASDILELAGVQGAEDPQTVDAGILVFTLHLAILEANLKGQPRGTALGDKGATPKAGSSKAQGEPEEVEESPGPNAKKVSELCCLCLAYTFYRACK